MDLLNLHCVSSSRQYNFDTQIMSKYKQTHKRNRSAIFYPTLIDPFRSFCAADSNLEGKTISVTQQAESLSSYKALFKLGKDIDHFLSSVYFLSSAMT